MRFVILLLVALLYCLPASAQNERSVWYFGYNAGLDFKTDPPKQLANSAMIAVEGCSSISDKNGNLLFYTNGVSVWNRSHNIMMDGADLGGHTSSSQGALIVPFPGNPERYYIFTSPASEISFPRYTMYAVVDMNADRGMGAVILKKQELDWEAAEKLLVIRHENGRDLWLLTHDLDSNRFIARHLSVFGIGKPVYSAVGMRHPQNAFFAAGYMKASHDGKKLAVSIRDACAIELFNFDNATGQVSNPVITVWNFRNMLSYGLEFSPDNSRLYVCWGGAPAFGQIDQFTITSSDSVEILKSKQTIVISYAQWLGALQLAPNGKIYMAAMNSPTLGVIHLPNEEGIRCSFQLSGQQLAGKFSGLGLPNSLPAYQNIPAFTFTPNCSGDSTRFFLPDYITDMDSVNWDFGDPSSGEANTSTSHYVAHVFANPGTYAVSLTVHLNDSSATIQRQVVITAPFNVNLGKDTTLCAGSQLALDANRPGIVYYQWSTGETSASITVREPGSYRVWVSDGICQEADTIAVLFRSPGIKVNADAKICAGDRIQLTATSAEELSYHWQPESSLDNPTSATPIANPKTTTTYTVTGRNKTGCTTTATVTITIGTNVAVDLGRDTTVCGTDTLVLKTALLADSYLWSTGETTPTITVSKSGTYAITISSGHCTGTDTIQVEIQSLDVAAHQFMCSGQKIQLRAAGAIRYEWAPKEGLSNATIAEPIASPSKTTTYRVIGLMAAGCKDTAFVTVEVQALDVVDNQIICSGQRVQLRATGAVEYEWSPKDGLNNPAIAEPIASPVAATTYRVIGLMAAGCKDTAFVTVEVQALGIIGNQKICSGQAVQLRAAGAEKYEWLPKEGISDPTAAEPTASPSTTTTYRVIGTMPAGCKDTAFVTVEVQAVPNINLGNDAAVCTEAFVLRAPQSADRYEWSTGETSASITVKTSGRYSVVTWFGTCTASDNISLIFQSPRVQAQAAVTQLCRGDSSQLLASGSEVVGYTWEPAAGLNNPTIANPIASPDTTTTYTVTGTTESGCTTTASVVIEVLPAIPLRVFLPELVGTIGSDNFTIPLRVEAPANALPLTIRNFSAEIRCSSSFFQPVTISNGSFFASRNGNEVVIKIDLSNVEITEQEQSIAELKGTLLLGSGATVPLRCGRVSLDRCVSAQISDGSLRLEGCLLDNRKVHYFSPAKLSIAPNPAIGEAVVYAENLERGFARIEVYTSQGKKVISSSVNIADAKQAISLPLHNVPTGIYQVIVKTAGGVYTTALTVAQ